MQFDKIVIVEGWHGLILNSYIYTRNQTSTTTTDDDDDEKKLINSSMKIVHVCLLFCLHNLFNRTINNPMSQTSNVCYT